MKVLEFPLEDDIKIIDFCNNNKITLIQFFILHQRTGRKAHEDFNLTEIKTQLDKFRNDGI